MTTARAASLHRTKTGSRGLGVAGLVTMTSSQEGDKPGRFFVRLVAENSHHAYGPPLGKLTKESQGFGAFQVMGSIQYDQRVPRHYFQPSGPDRRRYTVFDGGPIQPELAFTVLGLPELQRGYCNRCVLLLVSSQKRNVEFFIAESGPRMSMTWPSIE